MNTMVTMMRKMKLVICFVLLSVITTKGNPQHSRSFSVEPIIQTVGQTYRTEVGGEVELECSVDNLGEMVQLWKRGARVLTAGKMKVRRDPRIRLRGTNLIIKKVESEDGGEYECEVETDEEISITIRHRLEILVPPHVKPSPANGMVLVKKGTKVELRCDASGNPPPEVSWQKRNDVLSQLNHRIVGSALELYDINRKHDGVYVCVAENGVGEPAVEKITLQVLYAPEITVEKSEVHGGVGQRVELSCEVHGEPEVAVTWYKDTMLLNNNDNRYISNNNNRHVLVIEKMREEEFGSYSCHASNNLGKARSHLTVKGNPETPEFRSRIEAKGAGRYKLSWVTKSYAPLEEYRLLYRKVPDNDGTNRNVEFAWNNIIINGQKLAGREHHQSFVIENLLEEATYEAQIQARNHFGWSDVSAKFDFFTGFAESMPVESLVKDYAKGYGSSARTIITSINLIIASLILVFSYVLDITFE